MTRLGNSDLLKISYSSGDPGITYNTLEILMKEFVNEYRVLRYGETDKVIEYFKSELNRIGGELTRHEDDLTKYNVDNRIINYYDETKEIAAINKEFELREQDVLFAYNSSKAMVEELERQMDENTRQAITNLNLVDKLREASDLTGKSQKWKRFPIQIPVRTSAWKNIGGISSKPGRNYLIFPISTSAANTPKAASLKTTL